MTEIIQRLMGATGSVLMKPTQHIRDHVTFQELTSKTSKNWGKHGFHEG